MEGRIVRLEPLAPGHEEALYAASRDPELWRWLSVVRPRTGREWRTWMEEAYALPGSVPFATLVHGTPLGSTRYLNVREHDRVVEIGWTWLAPAAWGTGANVEAKLLMLEHAFEGMRMRRVEFKTDALNERSRRALEALPAQFEGVHRRHMLVRGGENRDSAWYSVIDEEWPSVRGNLLRRLEQA